MRMVALIRTVSASILRAVLRFMGVSGAFELGTTGVKCGYAGLYAVHFVPVQPFSFRDATLIYVVAA